MDLSVIEIKEEPLDLEVGDCEPSGENFPTSLESVYKKHFPSGIEFVHVQGNPNYYVPGYVPRPPATASEEYILPVQEYNFPQLGEAWIKQELPDETATDPLRNTVARRGQSSEQQVATEGDVGMEGEGQEGTECYPKRGRPPSKCEYCDGFVKRGHLADHLDYFHSGELPYLCDKCDGRFATAGERLVHATLHAGPEPFFCKDCDARFRTRGELKAHARRHTGGEGVHRCVTCDARFVTRQKYVIHMRSHTGERPYPCLTCGMKFTQAGHMKAHVQLKHGRGKTYPCNACGMMFARTNHLTDHLRTHTGEKPFPCTQCDKRFSRRPHLVRHMSKHTGSRPFTCDLCVSSFSRKDDLERHIRGHTSDRRYACPDCDSRFLLSHHLKVHRRQHLSAGARTWVCKHCSSEFSTVGRRTAHVKKCHAKS